MLRQKQIISAGAACRKRVEMVASARCFGLLKAGQLACNKTSYYFYIIFVSSLAFQFGVLQLCCIHLAGHLAVLFAKYDSAFRHTDSAFISLARI